MGNLEGLGGMFTLIKHFSGNMSIPFSFAEPLPLHKKQFSQEQLMNKRKVLCLKFVNQVTMLPLLDESGDNASSLPLRFLLCGCILPVQIQVIII